MFLLTSVCFVFDVSLGIFQVFICWFFWWLYSHSTLLLEGPIDKGLKTNNGGFKSESTSTTSVPRVSCSETKGKPLNQTRITSIRATTGAKKNNKSTLLYKKKSFKRLSMAKWLKLAINHAVQPDFVRRFKS